MILPLARQRATAQKTAPKANKFFNLTHKGECIMSFDKSKPHGTIFGDAQGRVYEQNGIHYRGDGSVWEPTEDELDRAAEGDEDEVAHEAATNQARNKTKAAGKAKEAKAKSVAAKVVAAAKPLQAAPVSAADQQVTDQLQG